MEREFVLFASKASTAPFDLNNLPASGRMDLVAACISSAFFVSYAIRKNVIFHTFLNGPPNPPKQITFYGNELSGIAPDEKSIAMVINEALKVKELNSKPKKVWQGVSICRKSFESFLKEVDTKIIYLHKNGEDIRSYNFPEKFLIVVGDHKGLPDKIERFLERLNIEKVSLGKVEYMACQCIAILHNELDRREKFW